MRKLSSIWGVLLLLGLAACSGKPQTGPGKVRWDQVSCERCRMALSDPHFSAQVRGATEGHRSKLYFFDDVGCAVLWLREQPWRDRAGTEMWVNDYQTGDWLDAFKASYTRGQITPMDFGLGARPDSGQGSLNYKQAVQEILSREEQLH